MRPDSAPSRGEKLDRGKGLVRQLRSIQPSLAVLYLGDRGRADEEVENAAALRAPFSLAELQEAVAAAVDRTAELR